MPIDRSKYPPDWNERSLAIRTERAANHCERCGIKNGIIICRRPKSRRYRPLNEGAQQLLDELVAGGMKLEKALKKLRLTKVILTTAHLDRDPSNNDPDNLMALCQKCHLDYDYLDNEFRRKHGREYQKHQLTLFTSKP